MKIFVAGATGVVGRRLLRELSARGHEVTGLARSPAKAELVRSLGALPAGADLFDPRSLAEPPPARRWSSTPQRPSRRAGTPASGARGPRTIASGGTARGP
ncbi:MAG: NAD(P)H-binding protein [Gemmatimonadetes bacterium]|nr:NAD(P)H-binding protein [Gemmatimonadota bacterium]NIQ53132.1 NAD(P)H-binding protein [Gemmatimonadota bacterium]NIU73279.1 NAD(P)H-binding protein [Gammaproteobacteria bacterium]NIX43538.1 NAD(P)H-binding protein [Gemmatimonadota bacterium]NIY07720.1 NAD(P)H-binding protein [Gemmatimonadota bacterium]